MMAKKKPQDIANVINANIAYLMTLNNMGVPELAVRIGISPPTLYARINNGNRYKIEELKRIATVFGISLITLIEERNTDHTEGRNDC